MAFVEIDKPRPHISVIRLNRPERLNSMSFEVVVPLHEAMAKVSADNDTWVVILTGEGRAFCSGLDLTDAGVPPGIAGLPMSRIAIRSMETMSSLVPGLRAMPQPVIAAIRGPAYGGGLCLSLGADIRVAGESALFRGAGINNGLTGTELGVSFLLPRLIGASRSNEIILSGREVNADEAERIGLVSRVVPDSELMDESLELAERMCRYSPHGIAMTKKILWSSLETNSLEAAIDCENRNQLLVRMTTENLQEAINARKENREPNYQD
jgi:enoyl-CoA hydratase